MRQIISISLPEKESSELAKAVKDIGKTKSDIIKEALRLYLWSVRFKKIRKSLNIKGKKAGILTDEDIFKIVS